MSDFTNFARCKAGRGTGFGACAVRFSLVTLLGPATTADVGLDAL